MYKLCFVPSMIIAELSGATIGRIFDNSAKVSAASASELYAYETPYTPTSADETSVLHEHGDTNGNY